MENHSKEPCAFSIASLSLVEGGIMLGLASLSIVQMEIVKWIKSKFVAIAT